MGTNYYWLDEARTNADDEEAKDEYEYHAPEPRFHIGKLSGSADWCTECGVITSHDGTQDAGSSHNKRDNPKECPSCHREDHVVRKGSFTWTKMCHLTKLRALAQSDPTRHVLEDENHHPLTATEFLGMLNECVPMGLHFQQNGEFF